MRIQQKLAVLNKDNCEEHARSKVAQNSNVPRTQEDYITQVSEEIETRLTKRFSQECSRTGSRIFGILSSLDDFLLNPLFQGHSGTAPETCRNTLRTNQGTNEDDSQSDPHPEAGVSQSQSTNSGTEDTHDSTHFRMRIILGTVLIMFLVFTVYIPEKSWICSGLQPDLQV